MSFLKSSIGNSLESTFVQSNRFEPLTLSVLKWASTSKNWGLTIRKATVITAPIDHVIKVIALPFIAIADHFKDLIAEKNYAVFNGWSRSM